MKNTEKKPIYFMEKTMSGALVIRHYMKQSADIIKLDPKRVYLVDEMECLKVAVRGKKDPATRVRGADKPFPAELIEQGFNIAFPLRAEKQDAVGKDAFLFTAGPKSNMFACGFRYSHKSSWAQELPKEADQPKRKKTPTKEKKPRARSGNIPTRKVPSKRKPTNARKKNRA